MLIGGNIFELIYGGFDDDILVLFVWFGRIKSDHCAEGELEGILLFQEVDAAKDEVESKGKFFLAG